MNRLPTGTLRELAKFCLDITKLTATAAFITPCFTAINVESYVTGWMAVIATISFVLGMALHYIVDHIEQDILHDEQAERTSPKEGEQKPKRREDKEGNGKRRRRNKPHYNRQKL